MFDVERPKKRSRRRARIIVQLPRPGVCELKTLGRMRIICPQRAAAALLARRGKGKKIGPLELLAALRDDPGNLELCRAIAEFGPVEKIAGLEPADVEFLVEQLSSWRAALVQAKTNLEAFIPELRHYFGGRIRCYNDTMVEDRVVDFFGRMNHALVKERLKHWAKWKKIMDQALISTTHPPPKSWFLNLEEPMCVRLALDKNDGRGAAVLESIKNWAEAELDAKGRGWGNDIRRQKTPLVTALGYVSEMCKEPSVRAKLELLPLEAFKEEVRKTAGARWAKYVERQNTARRSAYDDTRSGGQIERNDDAEGDPADSGE